jgi:hypothetical protein
MSLKLEIFWGGTTTTESSPTVGAEHCATRDKAILTEDSQLKIHASASFWVSPLERIATSSAACSSSLIAARLKSSWRVCRIWSLASLMASMSPLDNVINSLYSGLSASPANVLRNEFQMLSYQRGELAARVLAI